MIEEVWSQLIGFTEQFVVPDWGLLVGLIPILLLVLVVLYVTWTIYRFATAGPTRRGKRRLTPVPPPGTHLPGGSFAPVIGAVGVLMLGIGLIEGGLWLLAGAVILGITLLYWGREFLREYDRLPSESTALVTTGGTAVVPLPPGALPAPEGTPPPGVHIPAPSFRPLLIAISMTLLVAGLILGGWALILGAIALVVTLVGWLHDALREYLAAVAADRTGHLDAGPWPRWPIATFAVLAWILAGGLLLSSGLLPNSSAPVAEGGPLPSGAAGGGGGGSAAPPPSLPNADVIETAQNTAFVVESLTAPADAPFTIAFDNKDPGQPHNIAISDASGAEVFNGKIITGPAVEVYDVPALPAGNYTFVCSVHPNMTGTLTAS
jgi:plastocyanin